MTPGVMGKFVGIWNILQFSSCDIVGYVPIVIIINTSIDYFSLKPYKYVNYLRRMDHITLTPNDKLVLYKITQDPNLNDNHISSFLGLNPSTVTKIRRKLLSSGFFRVYNIPQLQNMGCELFSVGYGEFNVDLPMKTRIRVGKRILDKSPESVISVGESGTSVSMNISRNFTELSKGIMQSEKILGEMNLIKGSGLHYIPMSFEMASFFRYFDYGPILRDTFDIEAICESRGIDMPPDRSDSLDYFDFEFSNKTVSLMKKERRVMVGLVKHPGLTDKALSAIIGVTRQTVSSMKKRFHDNNLLQTIIVPDIQKLGFQGLVFIHAQVKASAWTDKLPELLDQELRNHPLIFSAVHGNDIILLGAFKTFSDARIISAQLKRLSLEKDIFVEPPREFLFSIPDMVKFKYHEYAGIAEKVLLRMR